MNEKEIRTRLKEAIGEAAYPPTLTRGVQTRLTQRAGGSQVRFLGVVAALLAALIVISLVYIRAQSRPASRPAASPIASSSPDPIPPMELSSAGLAAASAVVMRPNLAATDAGRTVILIGAYADPI